MAHDLLYEERLSSNKTTILFLVLMILFLALLIWRMDTVGLDALSIVFLCLFGLFLFYSINYRTLKIQVALQSLKLTFGIFAWTIPIENIADCQLDDLPIYLSMGGAGIHFFFARKRYRASFNFLEFPIVAIVLKRKQGPVRDISFSTRCPDEVLRHIREAISARSGT